LISTPIDDRELAFVLPRKQPEGRGLRPFSRLVIVDVPTAEVKVDVDLGSDRLMHLNYLRAFRDRDRYYINFQRSIANRGVRHYSYFATDTYLPSEHMQGDLYAIDARSGALLWNRAIPQRSFLRLPGVRLPFLVALARTRDRWNGGQQSLVLEVLDARTGETLGGKDDIFQDRIGQFAYDPGKRRLELSGWHTTVRVDFGPDVIELPAGDEPF
ncbi:MAG TPA: hypothetical protein VML55_24515, partial [Planctomycetaceae bacterium]|nr:hypothetical protein [Planctomycetaceae bacterium]